MVIKDGLPPDADFVFDMRCLQNPYWEPELRNLNGHEQPVKDFLSTQPKAQDMIKDIADFLERWMPHYRDLERTYLTVAIECTGGQYRSVYIAEAVAKKTLEKLKFR
ncbi:MAG: RNase adapter RapZ [Gammaproteobacteria bacterium]|nr:RNase adapter RapZ [Gammaproteobacteria bacterium]